MIVKLDKKAATGELSCKVCGQHYQTNINCMWHHALVHIRGQGKLVKLTMFSDLSAAVDVYSDWIDACDAVAKDAATGPGAHPSDLGPGGAADNYSDGGLDNDDDLGIMDDEIGEAEYNE